MKLLKDVFIDVQGTVLANKGSAALDKFFMWAIVFQTSLFADPIEDLNANGKRLLAINMGVLKLT